MIRASVSFETLVVHQDSQEEILSLSSSNGIIGAQRDYIS